MAEIFVRHSLNSRKAVKFNLSLKEVVAKSNDGERIWTIEVGTTYPTASGTSIPPVYINNVTETTLEDEINKAIASMCSVIDWTVLEEDKDPPYIDSFSPSGNYVPIKSVVEFVVKEYLPSSGIDLSEIKVTLNNGSVDFDITSEIEITGDPYEYKVKWAPPNI